jgi:predicted ATPase
VEIVLATGRGVLHQKLPVGQVIDRAVAMLKARQAAAAIPADPDLCPIYVDDTSAALLTSRFTIGGEPGARAIYGERTADDGSRLLLGKPTPYVGRERETAMLERLWSECAAEPRARLVLVTGPAGTGKSRLRHEFLKRVQRPKGDDEEPLAPVIWSAECDLMRAGSPFGALRQILRRAATIIEGEPLQAQRDKFFHFVAQHLEPAIAQSTAEILGEITGAPFPDEQSPALRAARADPALLNEKVRLGFETLATAASAKRPLLIVVEDLHWGDTASAQAITALIRRHEESRIMALFLARPEVRDLFPKLLADEELQEVRLGDLSKKAGRQLARKVLGDAVPDERIERIIEQAAGNAFYLEELIRAVAEGQGAGGGASAEGAVSGAPSLPDTVLAMIESRLLSLEAPARRIMRAGSVFGEVFWEGGVTALLSGSEGE